MEGTSANPDSGGSYSSRSDGSDYEPTAKSHQVSHCNFSSRRSFLSKAIHPLSFPTQFTKLESSDTFNPQRDAHRWSSGSSSVDFTDASESFSVSSEGFNYKCGLCERFLSQRSPWSSHRIIRSGDMPVAGVLSCRHVFHAECLEQTTLKTRRDDPPCPLCLKSEEIKKSPEHGVCKKSKNGVPRLNPSFEDGPSKPWGCTKAGDCVEGALHAPSRNTLLVLNKNRIRKSLSLKGSLGKENPGKLRTLGSYSSQLFSGRSGEQGAVGCSKSIGSPSMKR